MGSQSANTEDDGARRVRRRRRRKRAPPGGKRQSLDAERRDRPAFLLDFPHDPELERLIVAFEAGNYLRIKSDAPRLAESAEDPAVRAAALELLRRTQPDPLIKYLFALSIALLIFMIIYAYGSHEHP
jgi:hypothetical protein